MPLEIRKSVQQMLAEATAAIETLSVDQARTLHGRPDVTFIDLRDPRELWREGGVPGARQVPRGMLEFWDEDRAGHGPHARVPHRRRVRRVEEGRRARGSGRAEARGRGEESLTHPQAEAPRAQLSGARDGDRPVDLSLPGSRWCP